MFGIHCTEHNAFCARNVPRLTERSIRKIRPRISGAGEVFWLSGLANDATENGKMAG